MASISNATSSTMFSVLLVIPPFAISNCVVVREGAGGKVGEDEREDGGEGDGKGGRTEERRESIADAGGV